MIEDISANLYRVEIPLPKSPLKSINSYMVLSPDRNLIIDTGMNRKVCMEAMQAGLDELDVDLERTDFFITHLHADHAGLVGSLAKENSKVYFNGPDAEIIDRTDGWDRMIKHAGINGFPEHILEAALQSHPGFKYSSERKVDLTILEDGDEITAGDYTFRCVQTPGHTQGHMCLYEPNRKYLLSGDHILIDITPNIQLWTDDDNPLEHYLSSLDKVYDLDIVLTLPGHRRLIEDCRSRIQELKDHHEHRADEVFRILEQGTMNAYTVASHMTWDIQCDSWEEFPIQQQWFATGEAIAHLKLLQDRGSVRREQLGGKTLFSLA